MKNLYLDPKYRIETMEEFRELVRNPKKKIEYTNAWANYVRYGLGINVMPAAWQVIDAEMKFIPCNSWKEYQTKPIPEELHRRWLDEGAFKSGIVGILGHVFHRPDRLGCYLSEVDMDNAVAIQEIIKWKGDKSLVDFGRLGLVTQHTAKLDSSAKAYIYSRTPLTNKDPNVSKEDTTLPSWEIRCLGRMAVMPGSRHKKGDPMIIIKDGKLEPFTLSDEIEQQMFEEYSNNLCIKHGLTPYLTTKNRGNGNTNSNNDNTNNNVLRDTTPLDPQMARMLSSQIGSYDEAIEIKQHRRHKTMLKIADSILFRHSDDELVNMESLRDWFILINEHCCKPPLGMSERDRIWNDAVEYVGRQKAIESKRVLTVSEAIRERPGANKTVRGTIVSVSSIFKVAMRLDYRCCNCNTTNEGRVNHVTGTAYFASDNSDAVPKKCVNCGEKEFTLIDECCIITDGKVVKLQNVDLSTDLDETLEAMLLGDHTKDVSAGEVVIIQGSIYYGQSNLGSPAKLRKTIALMTARFVTYEGRQNIVITYRDIESFHRFAQLNQRHDIIARLISMTAPNVIGEEGYKLGVLRSIVGGRKTETSEKGRIDTLSIGDKGLGKSTVMREAVNMKPNARLITAQSASSRSALGIVDVANDVRTLTYGPIALSSGSLVGIDEIQTWQYDDQGSLLNVMQEGKFNLLKWGKDKKIAAETTIIAVANPQDIDYANRDSISIKEIKLLPPLLDRFDQIYVALDQVDEEKDWDYSGKWYDYTRERKLHNYNFILKYLVYAQNIRPILTPEAVITLRRFWIQLRQQGIAGKRSLGSIFRIAEATAKLRLREIVDNKIAQEVQESIQLMQQRLGEVVRIVEDPRDMAVAGAVEIIENTQTRIAFEEAVRLFCKENKCVRSWMYGGSRKELSTSTNKRFREVHDRFLQEVRKPDSKIVILSMSPLIVKWQTAKADTINTTATCTVNKNENENDQNDQNDQNDPDQNVGDQKSTADNGDKAKESPNQDSIFSTTNNESRSFRSFRSFSQNPIKGELDTNIWKRLMHIAALSVGASILSLRRIRGNLILVTVSRVKGVW